MNNKAYRRIGVTWVSMGGSLTVKSPFKMLQVSACWRALSEHEHFCKLTTPEKLQMINHRPLEPVAIHLVRKVKHCHHGHLFQSNLRVSLRKLPQVEIVTHIKLVANLLKSARESFSVVTLCTVSYRPGDRRPRYITSATIEAA